MRHGTIARDWIEIGALAVRCPDVREAVLAAAAAADEYEAAGDDLRGRMQAQAAYALSILREAEEILKALKADRKEP